MKYVRVGIILAQTTISVVMPFGITTTAEDLIHDACLLCRTRYRLDVHAEDVALGVLRPRGDGFDPVARDATLSRVPQIIERLHLGRDVEVTLVPSDQVIADEAGASAAEYLGDELIAGPSPAEELAQRFSVVSGGTGDRSPPARVSPQNGSAMNDPALSSFQQRLETVERELAASKATNSVLLDLACHGEDGVVWLSPGGDSQSPRRTRLPPEPSCVPAAWPSAPPSPARPTPAPAPAAVATPPRKFVVADFLPRPDTGGEEPERANADTSRDERHSLTMSTVWAERTQSPSNDACAVFMHPLLPAAGSPVRGHLL